MLADLLHPARITTSLRASDRDGVLRALANLFTAADPKLDGQGVYDALLKREMLASTGVGHGVALPHGRVGGLAAPQAAIAIHPSGVPFRAVDGQPVRIFVGILGPEDEPGAHLQTLAQVSKALRDADVRERLLTAKDADQVLTICGAAPKAAS